MDTGNEEPVALSELVVILNDIENYYRDVETSVADSNEKDFKTQRKRIRKVGSVPYSTDLQRRRKMELLSLRSEVQTLENQLAQLRQKFNGEMKPVWLSQPRKETWRDVATVAYEGRCRAENSNRELKQIMANHVRVFTTIQKLLQGSNIHEAELIFSQAQSRQNLCLAQANTANSVLAEITNNLEQMYLQAYSAFPPLDKYVTVALRTRRRLLDACGTLGDDCIEIISVTPMACTISKSGAILWKQIVSRRNTEPDKLYRFIREKGSTNLEMSFTLPLRDGSDKLLYIDAVSAYRNYEEKDRFVLVSKTCWVLRAGGLEFETLHWTIISPLPKASPMTSVVQSCNRLVVKTFDSTSSEASQVQNMLFTSIGNKLRKFMEMVQNCLLRSVTSHPPDSLSS